MKRVGKDNGQQALIDAMRKPTQIVIPSPEDSGVKIASRLPMYPQTPELIALKRQLGCPLVKG